MRETLAQWFDPDAWRWTLASRGIEDWRSGREPCLLLDLRGAGNCPDPLIPGPVPCPIVGRIDEGTSPKALAALDCWIEGEQGIEAVEANLARAPVAATVLAQLCRALECLDTPAALDMESLAYATLQAGREHQSWLKSRAPATPVKRPDYPPVLLEREQCSLLITLNRPEQRNAMSMALRDSLAEALELAVLDTDIECVILQGRGKCFSIGGDLDEFGQVPDPATGHWIRSVALPARVLCRVPCNSVARLHGACIGAGIELPAFAKSVVAAPGTHFRLPELSLGLIPGAGGCVSIPRRIGRQRFLWLVLSGRRINTERALQWGLIDAIESLPASTAKPQ